MTKPQFTLRVFVDLSQTGRIESHWVATCDRYPLIESYAADEEHAIGDLLRKIADKVEQGDISNWG